MSGRWLHAGGLDDAPAKARNLARMAAAGLPVPRGWVFEPDAPPRPSELEAAIAALLADGPVIVRAALAGEDEASATGAGLGLSLADCRSVEAVKAAIRTVNEHRSAPSIARWRGDASRADRIVLQRQIEGRCLLVCAILPDARVFAEVYTPGDALAGGSTPRWAGRLRRWDDPARPSVERLCEALRETMDGRPHGLDAEIVVDREGTPWLVQVRPIVEPLLERWEPFMAEVRRLGLADELEGCLILDAEHNPEPLSFAHAWLVRWLAAERPKAGEPKVLAGWLYVRTLVRDLSKEHRDEGADPHRALERLHHDLLPRARERLAALDARVSTCDRDELAELLDEALAAFVAMIDAYLGVLVPARAVQRTTKEGDPRRPMSLRERDAFLDVLPATWDVASPSLAELADLGAAASSPGPPTVPSDRAAAATLLEELDDHLFALGLAPVRRVWLRAGALLGIGDDVFCLEGPELAALLRDRDALPLEELVASRRADAKRWAALDPPPRIEDGEPVPVPPSARLQGIPIGPDHTGPIARRDGLEDLLARPPGPETIVVLPALTAQTAVALHHLSLRAVVCEHGGALSHAALMARELGLSALIGCRGCMAIPDGTPARLDTRIGRLRVLTPTRA